MSMQITKKDVAAARRVYWWLLLAPAFAMPCWIMMRSAFYQPNLLYSIWTATVPLLFYLPVFVWAFSFDPFLRVHARQGLILLGLRFLSTVLLGSGNESGFLMVCLNGSLWLVPSLVGLAQAGSGRAWVGNIHAEIVKPLAKTSRPEHAQTPEAQKARQAQMVTSYLQAFRSADAATRTEAARRLEALGQVETF